MNAVKNLQDTIAGAAERVGPSVVGLGRGWGHGSGVVIGQGQVLTSAHNLRREEVTVSFAGRPARARGAWRAATRTSTWPCSPSTRATPRPCAGSRPRRRASARRWWRSPTPAAAACGPRSGFVSSGGRSFRGPRGRRVRGAIEHTAPLPRGSSGGPLVDPEGSLLGLNSLRLDGGLILAVPASAAVKERALLLARGEAPAPHRLGVAIAPPRVARRLRSAVGLPERDGLLVRAVEDGSPARGRGPRAG